MVDGERTDRRCSITQWTIFLTRRWPTCPLISRCQREAGLLGESWEFRSSRVFEGGFDTRFKTQYAILIPPSLFFCRQFEKWLTSSTIKSSNRQNFLLWFSLKGKKKKKRPSFEIKMACLRRHEKKPQKKRLFKKCTSSLEQRCRVIAAGFAGLYLAHRLLCS